MHRPQRPPERRRGPETGSAGDHSLAPVWRDRRSRTRSDAPNGRARRPSPATASLVAAPNCQGSFQETHSAPAWVAPRTGRIRGRLEGPRSHGGAPMADGPLIVQSDKTLLLEVDHPDALACRMAIAPFAELERSPEHVHTYRLTPLGLWNARAAGHDAESVVDALLRFSRYPVPHALLVDVADTMDRYGRLQLVNDPVHGLVLRALGPGGAGRGGEVEEARRHARRQDRRRHDAWCTRPSGAASSRHCSSWAGRRRTWPGTSMARPTRSPCTRTGGSCAPTSTRPSSTSGPAGRGWWSCRAGPARPWSARPPWPRPAPPR